MTLYEKTLSAAILISLGIWIYSSLKKQSIKETLKQIKEAIVELNTPSET